MKQHHFAFGWKQMHPARKVALGFFAVILLGGFLLALPVSSATGESVGFFKGLFTSTSAVCVTGLVILDTGTAFSLFGQTVIITLIQIGGLGFMTAASMVFILLRKRITLRERMVLQESLNADSLQGWVQRVIRVAYITFIIEGAGALILMTRFIPMFGFGMGIYRSVFIAISAFCNAGFDPFGGFQSLTNMTGDMTVNIVVMALIILGGFGFAALFDVVKNRRWSKWMLHTRIVVVMTVSLVFIGAVAFTLMEWSNPATMGGMPIKEKVMAGAFQSVTTRTAGFNSIDQAGMSSGSKLLSMVLMFIGASPASTGGGIKTTTAAIIVLAAWSIMHRRNEVTVSKRRIARDLVRRAAAITMMGISIVFVGTLAICIIDPAMTLESVLFEVFSAFGTVGISYGITPDLHPLSQIIIMLIMFCGRVGPMTLGIALSRKQGDPDVRYPEARIMVG